MEELTEKIDFYKDGKDYATDMPIWKFILLYIFTIGFYGVFWIYMNMRMLNHAGKSQITPWVAIFLSIPIVPYYFFYKILQLNNDKPLLNHIKTILLLIVLYFFQWTGYWKDPYFWLGLLTVLPVIFIQLEINRYIKNNRI